MQSILSVPPRARYIATWAVAWVVVYACDWRLPIKHWDYSGADLLHAFARRDVQVWTCLLNTSRPTIGGLYFGGNNGHTNAYRSAFYIVQAEMRSESHSENSNTLQYCHAL